MDNIVMSFRHMVLAGVCASFPIFASSSFAQSVEKPVDDTMVLLQTSTQTEATKITDNIYMAEGFGNTFLVTTPKGNVIVDTSMARNAKAHKALLDKVDDRAPAYIIITHAHGDHIGGVTTWKAPTSKVIQQAHAEEFMHYQERLKGFFLRRNAAQFGFNLPKVEEDTAKPNNYDANIPADILFDKQHKITLGGLNFEIFSMPSETYDALTVWIPERKAVFVGDLFYESFPNIYTLRGTKPRWALDYASAIDRVLALKPEILIPSHGDSINGNAAITEALVTYRDAILYVHDAVVEGMNAGKSVDELVKTIELPKNLNIGETYGRVDWSVRGIYEGYAGWFDGNPSTMLSLEKVQAHKSLIALAGGHDVVAALAAEKLSSEKMDEALTLADMVLNVSPDHAGALKVRREAFQFFLKSSQNFNEIGWLKSGVRETDKISKKE